VKKRPITEFERRIILEERLEDDFDQEFFDSRGGQAHKVGTQTSLISSIGKMAISMESKPGSQLPPKGLKTALKRNKNIKLRNVFAHHDIDH
jgi:hypothetical protein